MIYPIHPRNNFGKDDSAYWDGFLTDDEMKYLLYHPVWKNVDDAYVGGDMNSEGVINKQMRRTDVSWLGIDEENQPLWEKITNVISEVNRRFFQFDLTGCYEPMQLGIYKAGDNGHYDWHTDNSVNDVRIPRKLSVSISLSEPYEYEGGELQIKANTDTPIVLENIKGRAWFFPSYMLHRVTPVTMGVRKSLVLWVGGPQFK